MDDTSRSPVCRYLPHGLLIAYLVLFTVCAIQPFDRAVWFAENLPIVLIVAILVVTSRWFRFSNASYLMVSVLIFMHTIGGHFTFERVPFDLVTETFDFERNHYDRVAHFSVGFYAFAFAELLDRKRLMSARWLLFLVPVMAIFTAAAVYEIIEWLFAVASDPNAGAAFLGSQGDQWDAQKDMLADGLGSIVAAGLYLIFRRTDRRPSTPEAAQSDGCHA
jgi:putative membrane protein